MNNESSGARISLRTRAWEFWRRNQLILAHLPGLLIFMWVGFALLKALDPRIGVEGWGDLFGYATNGVRVIWILVTTWWVKKWCWFDLHGKTEHELFQAMRKGDEVAFWIVVKDRVEWAVLLFFSSYWYTR